MIAIETLLLLTLAAGPGAPALDLPSRLVPEAGPLAVGRPLPSFAGFDLDGQLVTFRGVARPPGRAAPRAVVISFFATWCAPCARNLPPLQRALDAAGPDVAGLLVDYGEEEPAQVRAFLRDLGVRAGPVLADRTLAISKRLGVTEALPRTFVVNAEGNVAAIFAHEGRDFEQVLARELAAVTAVATAGAAAGPVSGAAPRP